MGPGDAFGWLGMVLGLAGTQVSSKTGMFLFDIGCSVANALHFYLLGAPGGVNGQLLFLTMSALGLLATLRPQNSASFLLVYPLIVLASWNAVAQKGPLEILPQCVVLLSAIGKQLDSMLHCRILILLSNVPCVWYGLAIGSSAYVTSTLVFTAFSAFAVRSELRRTAGKPSATTG
jgi:hypothetical protein